MIDESIFETNSVQLSLRKYRDSLINIRQSLGHRHYCFRDLRIGSAYNYERETETDGDGDGDRETDWEIAKL